MPMDQSLAIVQKLYEEGIALVRSCSAKLDQVEKKIKLLNETADDDADGNGN